MLAWVCIMPFIFCIIPWVMGDICSTVGLCEIHSTDCLHDDFCVDSFFVIASKDFNVANLLLAICVEGITLY